MTWATGTRAAAPALVRQAVAVIPAARRSGMTTPCAPNAARRAHDRAEVARVGHPVERHEQRGGRLRGRRDQVVEGLVGVRGHLQPDALVQHATGHPVEFERLTSSSAMPRSAAVRIAS